MPTEKSSTSKTAWKPFTPDVGHGRPSVTDRFTVLRSGSIRVSEDIAERLGKPDKIQLLTNGASEHFAVCPAETPAGSVTLTKSGRQREFRVGRLFAALGKNAELIVWPLDLPHSWDGDYLVINISDVPNADPKP